MMYTRYMRARGTDSPVRRVSVGDARSILAELLNRAAYRGERILLHRRGKEVAALVPVEDLRLLEVLEDRHDAQEAKRILAEMEARSETPVPYEQVRRKLGLGVAARRTSRRKSAG